MSGTRPRELEESKRPEGQQERPELVGARLTDQSKQDLAKVFAGPSAEQQRELMGPFKSKDQTDGQPKDVQIIDGQRGGAVVADGNKPIDSQLVGAVAAAMSTGRLDVNQVRGDLASRTDAATADRVLASASLEAGLSTSMVEDNRDQESVQNQARNAARSA